MIKNNSGNVLFLILIAVALFAALSYAITQSSRGGGNIAKEQAMLKASQIMQWYATAQTNMQRLAIRNNIDVSQVQITNGNSWTHCTSGTNCLWAPEGGDVTYHPDFPPGVRSGTNDSLIDSYAGSSNVSGFTNTVWILLFGIDADFCAAYQDYLKLGPPGATQSAYPGEYTACYFHSSSNTYAIYFVLYGEKT